MIEKQIPRDKCLDSTLAFWQEGYLFIQNRIKRYHSDLFETRLLGKRTICMSGKEAAKLFYNTELFQKKNALPKRVQKTLFGVNAIQTMDGVQHICRKKFFMSLLSREYEEQLIQIVMEKWEKAAKRWISARQVILFDEVNNILCQAVCEWTGVPLSPEEEKYRAEDFAAMVDAFGAVGCKYWKGKIARKRTENWIKEIIKAVRCGCLRPEENSILYKMAYYKENGKPLDLEMAAIELINILRPVIAVSRFITFAVLGVHEHSGYREKLRSQDADFLEMFVQEVRRYYPFTPCLGAVVKKSFKWKGYRFRKGTLVLLDVYGINHDARIWKNPNEFFPERFCGKKENQFGFIPQGGGNPGKGHRCPGEKITIELMKVSLDFLIRSIEFETPAQNLSYSLREIPAMPESGFIMKNIYLTHQTYDAGKRMTEGIEKRR